MIALDSMFELATALRDEGRLHDSASVLSKILQNYPVDERTYGVHTLLGGVYKDLGESEKAWTSFKHATELNPKYELASLGLYVTLINLNRDVEAIEEMIRYLALHPANFYIDTLKELVEGLENGYMTDYGEIIRKYAKKNGIEI